MNRTGRPKGTKPIRAGISRAEFSRLTGIPASAVGEMCKYKLLPMLEEPGKPPHTWGIDPACVPQFLATNGNGAAPATDAAETSSVQRYWEARAVREGWAARLAELKFKESEGELLNKSEIEDVLYEMARMARDRVLAVPDRLGLQRVDRIALRRELEEALEGLAEDLEALGRCTQEGDDTSRTHRREVAIRRHKPLCIDERFPFPLLTLALLR
jgi:hypothetical protein